MMHSPEESKPEHFLSLPELVSQCIDPNFAWYIYLPINGGETQEVFVFLFVFY